MKARNVTSMGTDTSAKFNTLKNSVRDTPTIWFHVMGKAQSIGIRSLSHHIDVATITKIRAGLGFSENH